MLYRVVNGQMYGVLNDYDLAIRMGARDGPTSKQRTGTLPYMAMELLETQPPPTHLFRHDLESFVYCIADMTLADVPDKHGRMVPALADWRKLSMKSLAKEKHLFLLTTSAFTDKDFKPGFSGYKHAISRFKLRFQKLYNALNARASSGQGDDSESNISVLSDDSDGLLPADADVNQIVTFKKFEKILLRVLVHDSKRVRKMLAQDQQPVDVLPHVHGLALQVGSRKFGPELERPNASALPRAGHLERVALALREYQEGRGERVNGNVG